MPDQRLTRFVSAIDPLDPDIQTNKDVVYILEEFCKPDTNLGGSIDIFDVSALLKYAIDFNEDGSFDFFDISAFLQSFQEVCP